MHPTLVRAVNRASSPEIILAYRHTYKALLRAVQYSTPSRYTARDCIRKAFRTGTAEDYDADRLVRTIELLDNAATAKGIEHRIVKNLMHVWYERARVWRNHPNLRPKDAPFIRTAYDDFDRTIESLNESMGLCIK